MRWRFSYIVAFVALAASFADSADPKASEDPAAKVYGSLLAACPEGLYRRYVEASTVQDSPFPQVIGANEELQGVMESLSTLSQSQIDSLVSFALRDGAVFVLDTLLRLHPPGKGDVRTLIANAYARKVPRSFASASELAAHRNLCRRWSSSFPEILKIEFRKGGGVREKGTK